MADGNFHASPLHKNDFASGVRAGEARMKTRVLNILRELLDDETLQKVRERLPMILIAMALSLPLSMQGKKSKEDYKQALPDLVNPLMGTQSTYELSAGNTYPAIARPWGMNFWTPQTGKNGDGWQYTYTATQLRGFKQTHQPSPWMGDYGYFSVMPSSKADADKAPSYFSHKAECARPYEYKVYLADHNTQVSLTATERCAAFSIDYGCEERYFVVDAQPKESSEYHLSVNEGKGTITGYTANNSGGVPPGFRNYFFIKLDQPVKLISEHAGRMVVALTEKRSKVQVLVASSFISGEQAQLNLHQEIGRKDYPTLVAESRAAWCNALGRIEVEGGTDVERQTFYSCLYRSLLFPRMLYEFDATDKKVHRSMSDNSICPGPYYTDTGFWDTFRALMPLLNLVYPDRSQDIIEGLLNCYRETGFLPEWASPGHRDCMIGNNSAAVVADAWVKGIRPSDPDMMYEALLRARSSQLEGTASGRRGYEYYNKLGYIPNDVGINESAARTLEYCYDDWCILQIANMLKRPKSERRTLSAASRNYKNLFSPEHNLMMGKPTHPQAGKQGNPFRWGGDFTEGNAWHYTWSVFHDVPGLISLMGGKERFEAMLDSVMKMPPIFDESYYGFVIHEIREMQIMGFGQYAHGNQPIQHMLYLYNYTDHPEKGRYWLREVMRRLYSPTPDGYCGDEDNGQTSAWYVFSAMGFYPLCPGSKEYATGAPLFKRTILHRPDGKVKITPKKLKKKFITL